MQKEIQKTVSIKDCDWDLAKRAAEKDGRSRPMWIGKAIREQAKREGVK